MTGGASPTLREVADVLLFRGGFNTTVVMLGAILLGVSAGVVGVFALLRKRSMTTDALSHATLPGIAGAFILVGAVGYDARSLPVLLTGAAATGVLGVVCIHAMLRYTRLREDAAIAVVLSVFFGVGVVLLSYVQANAADGSAGLKGFIYGRVATLRPEDVRLMAVLCGVAVVCAVLLLKEFTVVCFNDSFARTQGWPVGPLDLAILGLIVLVTVAGLQAVGLIMVVALLIIPPVAARFWTERVWLMVVLSGVLGGLSAYMGASLSALLPGMPAGAVIVLCAGAVFVVSMLAAPTRGVIATALRMARMRVRIAGDHLLEAAYEHGGTLDAQGFSRFVRERGWSSPFRWLITGVQSKRGLIARTRTGIQLTDLGTVRGARISRNHMLWSRYLVRYADIAPSHVDWTVDQVEHVLSEDLIRELEAEMDVPASGLLRGGE